jgi:hypothetical protein
MKKLIYGFCGALSLMASNVYAAVDLTGFTVDVVSVETMAGIVLTGLASLWGIRKLIKTINRS